MQQFPLAIYTAEHGLAWTYPRDEIDFATLDMCRKVVGMPDFDSGASGYDAVWVTDRYVFVMRCQSVSQWDFRGRDATYLAVTWMPRDKVQTIDVEALLRVPAFTIPTHTPSMFFTHYSTRSSFGCSNGFNSLIRNTQSENKVFVRYFGEDLIITKNIRAKNTNGGLSAIALPLTATINEVKSSREHMWYAIVITLFLLLGMSAYYNYTLYMRLMECQQRISEKSLQYIESQVDGQETPQIEVSVTNEDDAIDRKEEKQSLPKFE